LDAREAADFQKFWGWFPTIISLAKEDISKMEEVVKQPLMFVLNYLSYQNDVQMLRDRDYQKQKLKNRQ
jgi:hypothetical protein